MNDQISSQIQSAISVYLQFSKFNFQFSNVGFRSNFVGMHYRYNMLLGGYSGEVLLLRCSELVTLAIGKRS